jgi:hypothetical protein
MYPYFIVCAIFALQALAPRDRTPGAPPPGLWLASILLILFVGTRLQVGADWIAYKRMFDRAPSTLEATLKLSDPGYQFLNWLFHSMGAGIWAVNLVCAALFVVGLRSLCRAQSDPKLAMMVAIPYLTVVVAMGYTRQGVAIGLVMLAISAALKKRFLLIAISLFLAIAFHKSAVIAVPLVALALTDTKAKLLGVVALGVVCYFVFVESSVDTLYDRYVTQQMQSSGAAIRVAMNLVPAVLFVLLRRRMGFSPAESRMWLGFTLVAFGTAIALALSPASTAVDRMALYVIPLQIAVLAKIPALSDERPSARVAIIAFATSVLVIWLNFAAFSYTWLPYRTYLWVPSDFVPRSTHL